MILVLNDLIQHLEMTDDGYKIEENCPNDKLDELKKINDEYLQLMGESLFEFS